MPFKAVWQKLWLLFSVIWIVVAAIQVFTILAFSPDEPEKVLRPILMAIAVPGVTYALAWLYFKWRGTAE